MASSYENMLAKKGFLPYRMGYLTDAMAVQAEEELNETEENRKRAIAELRRLISKEKDLNVWTDDNYLLQFLRARKFDVKRAWDLFQHFYTVKKEYPDVYPQNVNLQDIRNLMDTSGGGCYNYRDQNGSVILFFKAGYWDADQVPIVQVMSALTALVMSTIEDPATQVCGLQVLVDAKDLGLKHIRSLKPRYIQLFSKALKNTLPLRFKGVHIVNESALFSYIYSILKLFLSEKIKNRIHFHGSDMKHLQKYVPKEILPSEYGGDNHGYNAKEWCNKEVEPFLKKFKIFHLNGYA